MTTYYLDYDNGSDAGTGADWANAWKTITSGPTAARIGPGDIIRIAKSPAPYSLGTASWTDLSKTVTLSSAANVTVDNCETAWTANGSGDTTVARVSSTPSQKQGSYCMKFTLDSSVQTSIMQAYYAIASTDFSSYQKITFWIYNSAAIVANNWTITLCSDTAGATPVDTFAITAIPSTARWVPLTLARNGGGNLGSAIQSIAINTGSVAPTASSYIALDNISAATTSGLNLQSLISKNSAEQGGTEGWYGLQSIVTTTLLLDGDTNTSAVFGEGYSGTTESVTTYARETIKTAMASSGSTSVQAIQDSGTFAGGNIQFQGGYNTSSGSQDGETFFDGLNGSGYGLDTNQKDFITLNYLNFHRYNYGLYFNASDNCTVTTLSNVCNNQRGLQLNSSYNNTFTTISNVNNNGNASSSGFGIYFSSSHGNTFTTISNANNNYAGCGIQFVQSTKNIINSITAKNNTYGVIFSSPSENNVIASLTTSDNATAGISGDSWNYIFSATISEATKASNFTANQDGKVFINSISGASNIWCDSGNIVSQSATAGGAGIEWKMSVTNTARASNYPLKLKLAEVACNASAQVTVTCYFKKSHATDIDASLVTPGGELSGVSQTTATCPDDTSRNQLQIQFTPSAAGVVTVEAWAWWVANTADENVIIDDIAITQA